MLPLPQSFPDPERPAEAAEGSTLPSGWNPVCNSISPPIVLSIAGYDPSAGAGVLADLKTFSALGVYGMASLTALTVQSTQGVRKVIALDPGTVTETLQCLAEDVRFAAIKVGMLGSGAVAAAVLSWLEAQENVPVILDPIMKSSSGKDLLDAASCEMLRREGLARATWITPNIPELAILTGLPEAKKSEETENLAAELDRMAKLAGNPSLKVVVTGGHAESPNDLFFEKGICRWFPGEWVETSSTHGTGCTFSSALAARVALGDGPFEAVFNAKLYVTGALQHAYPVGNGKGPLNHSWKKT